MIEYTQCFVTRTGLSKTNYAHMSWDLQNKLIVATYQFHHVRFGWNSFATKFVVSIKNPLVTGLSMPAGITRIHNDPIKWKYFPHYWPIGRVIHRSLVNSPQKGQWYWALMFSLICTRMNGWVNNLEAADLRCHRAHYDVTVMRQNSTFFILSIISKNVSFINHKHNEMLCIALLNLGDQKIRVWVCWFEMAYGSSFDLWSHTSLPEWTCSVVYCALRCGRREWRELRQIWKIIICVMPYARKARLTSSHKTDPMRLQTRFELPHIFHMVVYYLWSRDDGCWCPGAESAPGRLQPSCWRKSIGLLQESSALWRCSEFAQNADIFSAKIREVTHSIWICIYIYGIFLGSWTNESFH